MNLDEMARQSSQSARVAVAHIQPSFDPPDGISAGVIVASVALVGVVGIAVIGLGNNPDNDSVDSVSTAAAPDSQEIEPPNRALVWESDGTSMVPALEELGIADSFVAKASNSSAEIDVIVGEADGQLCLLTHGEHNFGRCTSDDIIVTEQPETEGSVQHAVATRLPRCISEWNIAFFGGATADQFPSSTGWPAKQFDIGFVAAQVGEATDDWQLLGYAPDLFITVDLPTGDATTNWPADVCDGFPDVPQQPTILDEAARLEVRIQNNVAAQNLGVTDNFNLIGTVRYGQLPDYLIIESGDSLCVLTDDPVVTAHCGTSDIVVVDPILQTDDARGIVMARLPDCLAPSDGHEPSLSGAVVDLRISAWGSSIPGENHAFITALGPSDGWRLLASGEDLFVTIDLPDRSGERSWPDNVCEMTGVVNG